MAFFQTLSRPLQRLKSSKTMVWTLISGLVLISTASTPDYFEISKNLDIFNSVYRELNASYVDGTKPGQLMKTGIDAMLQSLDPYTIYYTENDIEDYRFMTTGEYGGVGATVNDVDGKIIVSEPYEGFAAYKAGIRAGDEIIAINGISVEGKKTEDLGPLLKGQAGTPVKLKVIKAGTAAPVEVTMNREEIKTKAVPYYGLVGDQSGYIKLLSFTENCSGAVRDALIDLKGQGAKSIILDLRGNPGGLLLEAVNIVNLFIDKGQEVVFTKGKSEVWDKSYTTMNAPVDKTIPLVVLVDEHSASASEIVSGALQDLDRAVVIGKRTYGKGLVQQTKELVYHSQIKVTVAKYYIPSGRCVQALDYTHRDEEGRVEKVPDSLITAFKTKGGRIVYDGAGVMPDMVTPDNHYANITATLYRKYYIFHYATKYALSHPSIPAVKEFHLTDGDYNDFLAFIANKDISYKTRSEEKLDEMKKEAVDDKLMDDISKEYAGLEKKISDSKKEDLQKFKKEIIAALEEEIIARYYFQKGRVEFDLRDSKEVNDAIALLKDQGKAAQLLTKVEKPTRPFNPRKKF